MRSASIAFAFRAASGGDGVAMTQIESNPFKPIHVNA
jgi:hypothetical protein